MMFVMRFIARTNAESSPLFLRPCELVRHILDRMRMLPGRGEHRRREIVIDALPADDRVQTAARRIRAARRGAPRGRARILERVREKPEAAIERFGERERGRAAR